MEKERTVLLFALALLGVGMVFALQVSPTVDTLQYTCAADDAACTTTTDTTSGICRTIGFSSAGGPAQVLVCHKDDGRYELYRQTAPSGSFQICVGAGCVNQYKGYDSFTADELPPTDTGYLYEDPSVFNTSCSFDGVACAKISDHTEGVCRTVQYDIDGDMNTTEVALLLCHKGDSRYELYRVFAPAGDLYASIGPGFVDGLKGYDSFVITAPVIPPVIPPTNETNGTNVTPPVCTQSATLLNATCVDGNITADTTMGTCRTIACESATGNLTVMACDKPDAGTKTYFEMYRLLQDGTPLDICLGDTCLDSDLRGYQRSADFCG